jgi:hypothetical protein
MRKSTDLMQPSVATLGTWSGLPGVDQVGTSQPVDFCFGGLPKQLQVHRMLVTFQFSVHAQPSQNDRSPRMRQTWLQVDHRHTRIILVASPDSPAISQFFYHKSYVEARHL